MFVHRSAATACSRTVATPTRTPSSWSEHISYWRVQLAVLRVYTRCWSTAGNEFRPLVLASTSYVIDYVTVLPTPEAEVLAAAARRRLAAVVLMECISRIRSVRQRRVSSSTKRPALRSATLLWNGITLLSIVRGEKAMRICGRRLRTVTRLRSTPGQFPTAMYERDLGRGNRRQRWAVAVSARRSTGRRRRRQRRRHRETVIIRRAPRRRRRRTPSPDKSRHQNLSVWRHIRDRNSRCNRSAAVFQINSWIASCVEPANNSAI